MAHILQTLAILVLLSPTTTIGGAAAPSCATIESELSSCVAYIVDRMMESPSPTCCSGVKSIAGQVSSKQDAVAVCNCIKAVLVQLGNQVVPGRVSDLPKKCGVPINLPPIDKNYDCSKSASSLITLHQTGLT
ncbi:hypothetical protein RD792_010724 [Penstemon davidsonii]|uniref:Non-specific lipid-transfer protein n=1 Tax=Penstemon davidsonii TaxID=160366 RepID=A0ABR0D2U7_9LAMI|nr:hypothetical protein RD792_010724 [Penstemon davidsonii]